MNNPSKVNVDLDALINWIESRKELQPLREQAEEIQAEYNRSGKHKTERIRILRDKVVLETKTNPFKSFLQTIWVPPRSLRGTSFSTSSVDKTLGTTSKMLSISTLWDFVCTLPLFTFGLSPLGPASFPAAVVLSYLILWASNVSGEKSTDRHDPVQAKAATLSVYAFLLLSLTKTAFSGVGVDLVLGSRGIQAEFAGVLAAEALTKGKEDFKNEIEPDSNELIAATKQCKVAESELDEATKNRAKPGGENVFQTKYRVAYGTLREQKERQGLNPAQVIQKFGSIGQIQGYCAQRAIYRALHVEKVNTARGELEVKSKAINSTNSLDYLREYEPSIYSENFRDVGDDIEWVNGTTAVAQATEQFWAKLLSGQFGQIGFSLFFLVVSLILSISATLMLYQVSISSELKASFDDDVLDKLNDRLQRYTKTMEEQVNHSEEG